MMSSVVGDSKFVNPVRDVRAGSFVRYVRMRRRGEGRRRAGEGSSFSLQDVESRVRIKWDPRCRYISAMDGTRRAHGWGMPGPERRLLASMRWMCPRASRGPRERFGPEIDVPYVSSLVVDTRCSAVLCVSSGPPLRLLPFCTGRLACTIESGHASPPSGPLACVVSTCRMIKR